MALAAMTTQYKMQQVLDYLKNGLVKLHNEVIEPHQQDFLKLKDHLIARGLPHDPAVEESVKNMERRYDDMKYMIRCLWEQVAPEEPPPFPPALSGEPVCGRSCPNDQMA
jgi:hypothetical protein